jgi:hypothetical protein
MALATPDCRPMASSIRIINEWEGSGRTSSWPVSRHCADIVLNRMRNLTEDPYENGRYSGRDSNEAP